MGKGWFSKLREGLKKTREGFVSKIAQTLLGAGKIDSGLLDSIEETLITSDMGVRESAEIIEWLKKKVEEEKITESNAIINLLKERMTEDLKQPVMPVMFSKNPPTVIMVVGVNGTGKTTSIAKLANRLKTEGRSVVLAAADTFRAAAVEQLHIWAERTGVEIIKHTENADPAAVAFDATKSAVSKAKDVLIIDTAGRLHTKSNLMEELKKVKRVIAKALPGAPHEVILVLDANIGQNSISQAKQFHEALDVTGIILTKLDGTAKGGVVFSIKSELRIPIKFIGIGEKVDDLYPFDSREFINALF